MIKRAIKTSKRRANLPRMTWKGKVNSMDFCKSSTANSANVLTFRGYPVCYPSRPSSISGTQSALLLTISGPICVLEFQMPRSAALAITLAWKAPPMETAWAYGWSARHKVTGDREAIEMRLESSEERFTFHFLLHVKNRFKSKSKQREGQSAKWRGRLQWTTTSGRQYADWGSTWIILTWNWLWTHWSNCVSLSLWCVTSLIFLNHKTHLS